MDDLSEAGLDLELSEFGKRLDSLLISRGWHPGARRTRRPGFEFSARRHSTDAIHVVLDAIMPEAAAKEIMALALRHGFAEPTQPTTPPARR